MFKGLSTPNLIDTALMAGIAICVAPVVAVGAAMVVGFGLTILGANLAVEATKIAVQKITEKEQ
jgi:hypothetical protein